MQRLHTTGLMTPQEKIMMHSWVAGGFYGQGYESIPAPILPRLLEVHPDFSIPTNFYPASPERAETLIAPSPSLFATAAAQQLHSGNSGEQGLCSDGSSGQDLSDRLARLGQDAEVNLGSIVQSIALQCRSCLNSQILAALAIFIGD